MKADTDLYCLECAHRRNSYAGHTQLETRSKHQGFYLELSFTIIYGGDANTTALSLLPYFSGHLREDRIDRNVQIIRLMFGKN